MVNGFDYGGATILSHPLFVEAILPFLLVFAIVFAILDKTKVLGDKKRQINAIVSLVIGLLFISFGQAVGVIIQLIPFLAVSLVVLLVFLLIWGMVYGEGKFDIHKDVKKAVGIIALIAVVIAMLWITDWWVWIYGLILAGSGGTIFLNVLFAVVIIAAVWIVVASGKETKAKED